MNKQAQLDRLLAERILILDGAMGTMVQRRKLDDVEATRAYDQLQQKALGLLTSGRLRKALDVQAEPAAVREAYEKFMAVGETPVLLTSPSIRPFVRSVIERFRPSTIVMSQNEIHPKAKIRTLGQV